MGKSKEVEQQDVGKESVEKKDNCYLSRLPVADVIPTPDNPRVINPKDPAFLELVESVKAAGVLVPVHVRPHPTSAGKFDLRAGERRVRAAVLAGLATIPAIVHRAMTDVEAFELTFTENFVREDLTPIEQSNAVKVLMEKHGGDVRAVAGQLGRSPEWVVRRSRLSNLSERWRGLHADTHGAVSRWSAGHLELIARLPVEDQDRFHEEIGEWWFDEETTIAQLDKELRNWLRQLKNAPWNLEEDELVPGICACTVCVNRSNATPGLFDSMKSFESPYASEAWRGQCLDKTCWDAKLTAYVNRTLKEMPKKDRPVLLRRHARETKAPKDLAKKAKADTWVKEVEKGTPGAKAMMRVEGATAGKVFYGKTEGPKRGGTSKPSAAGKDHSKARLAELKEQLRRKRWKSALDAARKRISRMKAEDLVLPDGVDRDLWILAVIVFRGASTKLLAFAKKMAAGGPTALGKHCLSEALADLGNAFHYWSPEHNKPNLKIARAISPAVGIDLDKLYSEAEKAVPEPKELTELREKVAATKKSGKPKRAMRPTKRKKAKKA